MASNVGFHQIKQLSLKQWPIKQ